MTKQPAEVVARAKVLTAIKHLTLTERLSVLADVFKAIGLPMFAASIKEALNDKKV